MPPPFLAPVPIQQFFDANGNPLAGGHLVFFLAGTSTASPAYSDKALTIPHPNPLDLDAAGRAPALWLDGGITYKIVLSDAVGAPIWTVDEIGGPASVPILSVAGSGAVYNIPVPSAPIVLVNIPGSPAVVTQVTGFPGGVVGQLLIIVAQQRVDLFDQHSNSLANDRLINWIGNPWPTPLSVDGTAIYVRRADGWYLVSHFQGQGIQMTPALQFGGASVGMGVASADLVYTVRGVVVWFSGRFVLSAKGSSTGDATISLPYPCVAGGLFQGSFASGLTGLTSAPTGYYVDGEQRVHLTVWSPTGTAMVTDAQFGGGTIDVIFTGEYMAGA